VAKSKPVASMTGFARQEGGDGCLRWTWEIKSVNGKSFDLRCRLAAGFEELEPTLRTSASGRFARGNLQVNLNINASDRPVTLRINEALLDQLLELAGSLKDKAGAEAPRLDGLLALRGVVETVEEDEDEDTQKIRKAAMLSDLDQAFDALAGMRETEGARLRALAEKHLERIGNLTAEAATLSAAQPDSLRERLRKQLDELLEAAPALPEERLAQEAAILITKADVREELDRLHSHVEAAQDLLKTGGPVGRRLDFLCQELNREANTLCAKSPDVELTRVGLELKNAIDQLREQVQNIE
jgi:uncharacterized protein (TIGR00255 family)